MSEFRIIPVIDLQAGQVVRGVAGRREEYRPIVSQLTNSTNPIEVAGAFRDRFGLTEIYVADLDAIAGAEPAWPTYAELRDLGFRLWVDAGVRDADRLRQLCIHGIHNPIVALETLSEPAQLAILGKEFGWEQLVFSLDLRDGRPMVSAGSEWAKDAGDIAAIAVAAGVRRMIVLDLATVGVGQGPSETVLRLCGQLHESHPEVTLIAGGGVRGPDDLRLLESAGVSAALVASALHDGRLRPEDLSASSPLQRAIQFVQSQLEVLQPRPMKIAEEIPDGPQRLRGLAGSGKTVILSRRAARIHAEHPDWDIIYVFFTRSLYGHIRGLITTAYHELTRNEPKWEKLRVLHAWGAKDQEGFYRALCRAWGQRPLSLKDVERNAPKCTAGEAFEYVCDLLEQDVPQPPQLFDAVLIDEGQDLPASFFRLAHKTLRPPKRLYWAYDEAQGMSSLIVPRPLAIFGTNESGESIVELSGKYGDGVSKAHNLNQSYRTPRLLLMAGHAINMGLFRKDGPLQGVTRKEEWEALGYEIVEGDFTPTSVKAGALVKVTRPDASLLHPVDHAVCAVGPSETLTGRPFPSEEAERIWIADQVAHDIQKGLRPDDILITGLSGENDKAYFGDLKKTLEERGIQACVAGVDTNRSQFRVPGHVTISGIYRAKGNEAWKVYACRFQYALLPQLWKKENELQKRNEAFVALTRAKLWCVVTGLRSPIFDELRKAKEQFPYLVFPAFSQALLGRIMDVELFDGIT